MKSNDFKLSKDEQETVIVATHHDVTVYTTNPNHWKSLKRRTAKLGGTVELVHKLGNREVGGMVDLPKETFSLSRFGLRASPPKPKVKLQQLAPPKEIP